MGQTTATQQMALLIKNRFFSYSANLQYSMSKIIWQNIFAIDLAVFEILPKNEIFDFFILFSYFCSYLMGASCENQVYYHYQMQNFPRNPLRYSELCYSVPERSYQRKMTRFFVIFEIKLQKSPEKLKSFINAKLEPRYTTCNGKKIARLFFDFQILSQFEVGLLCRKTLIIICG